METKTIVLGLAGILLVGGLVAFSFSQKTPVPEEETPAPHEEEVTQATFNSSELGLMFNYPSTYTLQTHDQGTAEREWVVLTLIDSEILQQAIENGASEGPPAIAVQIFNNPEGYSAEEWVRGMSYSNYKLSSDGVLAPVTLDGEQALSYRYSGLFETDALVVVRGGKVYMFSVDWMTEHDANIHDFAHLLETVTFY